MGTIFIPQYLGALRLILSDLPNKNIKDIAWAVFILMFAPFHMYILHHLEAFANLKLKEFKNEKSLIRSKEDIKRTLHMHIKLELGLETIYQLTGQLILLLLSYTETATEDGLKTIFNEGLTGLPFILLIVSICLSFWSCISSHWKALTACREHFPLKSKIVVSLYSLFAILTRILTMIMYIAGPLGLFNLLRHYEGQQYPWNVIVTYFVDSNGKIFLGDNEPFEWSLIENKTPPEPTAYFGLSIGLYLAVFFAALGIQVVVVFLAKYHLSQHFRKSFNFLEKIIHSMENTNIPYNSQEWDDGKGDAEEHRKRMRSNWFEVGVVVIIKFVFNSLHLLPLSYLGIKLITYCY